MNKKKKIAFVVGRYGAEVAGGAELHARLLAEHLVPYFDVSVITTKAVDYTTWEDHYTAETEEMKGVHIRRFSVDAPRDVGIFNKVSTAIFDKRTPNTLQQEEEWMKIQGPYSTPLFTFLKKHEDDYDAIIFVGYLYALTYFGVQQLKRKPFLIPTAHEEPPIHLGLFQKLFKHIGGLMVSTPEELQLIRGIFHNEQVPAVVVAVGLETVQPFELSAEELCSRFKLQHPYMLYMGRIEAGKGVHELFDFFQRYKHETQRSVDLVLVGKAIMDIPKYPDVKFLGFVSPEEKYALIQHAQFVVNPSFYESLSLIVLESWQMQRPVLVNGRSDVLQAQASRAQAGLYYTNFEEFMHMSNWLFDHTDEGKLMGENGKTYVEANYAWNVVEQKFVAFLEKMMKKRG